MTFAAAPNIAPRILLIGFDAAFHRRVRDVVAGLETMVGCATRQSDRLDALVDQLDVPYDAVLHLLPDRAARRTLVVRAGELDRRTAADEAVDYLCEIAISPDAALLFGALLRRSLGPAPMEIVADGVSIDVPRGVVTFDGAVVPTDPTELAFVSFLAAHQGGSFTRAELARAIAPIAA